DNIRRRGNQALQNYRYFQDRAARVSREWADLNSRARSTPASDPLYDLLVLDRDQRKKEYEFVREKLSDVEAGGDAEERKLGWTMELLDPATLPEQPDTPVYTIWLTGLSAGLGLGMLLELWRVVRGGTQASWV